MEPEHSLIQRAQKGDSDAFAALVDEHQRFVYNLAFRVLKDENEALDLTQDTFVRAWTALPNFRGQSQFRTWLYRITTNLCYNRLPGLRRSLTDLGDDVLPDLPDTKETSSNPLREIESNEIRTYLHQAIDQLDANYKLLIIMRYHDELSYEEIASLLNLPLGTVKTGLFRAKDKLRLALEGFNLEEKWKIT
ncbi:MAG TPA: sigma-70 family RNA polymerase sigma factor [Anaerolineales bacterium]|nr:sigma-70 family RNA polymerase sigma factor [Anaerolineales bacterium]